MVAEIVPALLLAPLAGPLVDRWPRVRVMIGSDVFRLALAVLLAVWHDAPVGVYAVAFAMSFAGAFFNPAASSVESAAEILARQQRVPMSEVVVPIAGDEVTALRAPKRKAKIVSLADRRRVSENDIRLEEWKESRLAARQ